MKVCTVPGCKIPISQSQEFCARCWNNVPKRYQDEFKEATVVWQRARIGLRNAVAVIRTEAAKELVGIE